MKACELLRPLFLVVLLVDLSLQASSSGGKGTRGLAGPGYVDNRRSSRASSSSAAAVAAQLGPSTEVEDGEYQDRLMAFLQTPIHPITVEHIQQFMGLNKINPRVVAGTLNQPSHCETILAPLFRSKSAHILPPSVLDVKHYLYQRMGQHDKDFYQKFNKARKHHQVVRPGSETSAFCQKGKRPGWPKPEVEKHVTESLTSLGISIEEVRDCSDPQWMAQKVLPLFASSKKNYNARSAESARRYLANIAWKPNDFINESLRLVGYKDGRQPARRRTRIDHIVSSLSYDVIDTVERAESGSGSSNDQNYGTINQPDIDPNIPTYSELPIPIAESPSSEHFDYQYYKRIFSDEEMPLLQDVCQGSGGSTGVQLGAVSPWPSPQSHPPFASEPGSTIPSHHEHCSTESIQDVLQQQPQYFTPYGAYADLSACSTPSQARRGSASSSSGGDRRRAGTSESGQYGDYRAIYGRSDPPME